MVVALSICACTPGPRILSTYGSLIGANQKPRLAAHPGVDFGGPRGAPVLATADGEVADVDVNPRGCGIGILLEHRPFSRFTLYCHLEEAFVSPGTFVRRGQVIGRIGTTGNWGLVPHVHLELCLEPCVRGHMDGSMEGTEDPLKVTVGCFDPGATYPTDRFVLIYPVKCHSRTQL
jgi:hypothetical protein